MQYTELPLADFIGTKKLTKELFEHYRIFGELINTILTPFAWLVRATITNGDCEVWKMIQKQKSKSFF